MMRDGSLMKERLKFGHFELMISTKIEGVTYMANDECVDAIYMDFAKAFDTVPHKRLLLKLRSLGFGEQLLAWLESFLCGRTQRVKVNGIKSPSAAVTSGIPQGTVLGPLLFVCFINDLPDQIRDSLVALFADDTKLYRCVMSDDDYRRLQADINRLIEWSVSWQLGYNESKCKVLHMGSNNPRRQYTMGDTVLEATEVEKDLGVWIDRELTFEHHVETQVAKANKLLGLIRRTFTVLDAPTMMLLFKALVRPHLEYAVTAWAPCTLGAQRKVEDVLRRATRLVPELRHLEYEDRLAKAGIPSMLFRRERADMLEMYKYINGFYDVQTPVKMERDSLDARPRPVTRHMDHTVVKERVPNTAWGTVRSRFFSLRATNNWNSLDSHTVSAPTLNCFKNRLDKLWKDRVYRTPYGAFTGFIIEG